MRQTARIVRHKKFSALEKHHHNFAFGGCIIGEDLRKIGSIAGGQKKILSVFCLRAYAVRSGKALKNYLPVHKNMLNLNQTKNATISGKRTVIM